MGVTGSKPLGRRFLSTVICGWLITMAAALLPAQETLIQVRAFLATESAEKPSGNEVTFYTSSSDPRLASVKAMVNGTESDLRAAALRVMPALRDIETVNYLFSLVLFWDGRSATAGDFVIQPPAAFRLELTPTWREDGTLDFRLALYAKEISAWPPEGSKKEAAAERNLRAAVHPDFFKSRMEKILERDVSLAAEEPGLLFLPYHDQTLVLFLMPAARPQPVLQSLPIYPDDLVRQGVAGQGRYRVSIDNKGAVRSVSVKTHLHPFLDDAAARAIREWTFEPVMKGLTAVAVSFDWTIDFDPARWPGLAELPAPRASGPYSAELIRLLALGAAYCERLSGAALDFVCHESIRSLDCALYLPETTASAGTTLTEKATDSKGTIMIIGPRRAPLGRDPFNTKTYRFTCDFQMVKKQGEIEEQRILLQSNVKSAPKGAAPPDEKRYASLKPLFAPIEILATDRQESYEFRLLGREMNKGRSTAVIEAVARPGAPARIPAAKIWIDPESSQILRCETQGLPVEGYEFIFEEASRIGIGPVGAMTMSYGVEENGILFPSRVTLLIEYPVNVWGVGKRTRIDTDIRYDQYRFFTVETEKAVIR
jgi:TonB family protein